MMIRSKVRPGVESGIKRASRVVGDDDVRWTSGRPIRFVQRQYDGARDPSWKISSQSHEIQAARDSPSPGAPKMLIS